MPTLTHAEARTPGWWHPASNGAKKRHWFVSRGDGTVARGKDWRIRWFGSYETALKVANRINQQRGEGKGGDSII